MVPRQLGAILDSNWRFRFPLYLVTVPLHNAFRTRSGYLRSIRVLLYRSTGNKTPNGVHEKCQPVGSRGLPAFRGSLLDP